MNRLLIVAIAAIAVLLVGFAILNDGGDGDDTKSEPYNGPFTNDPASGEVSLLETNGGKATYVATPYPGSAFKGWYDADGNELSKMLAITIDQADVSNLIARFGGYTYNIVQYDWNLPILDDDGNEISTQKMTFSVAVSDSHYFKSLQSIDISRQSTKETPMPNHLLRDDSVVQAMVDHLAPLVSGMSDRDKAIVINAFVQDIITYKTDKEQYGKTEFWTTAYEATYSGYGDCEDTATMFVNIALRMGLDAGYVAFDRSGMGHMSAAVNIGGTGSFNIDGTPYTYVETAVDSAHVKLGTVPTGYTIDEGKWTKVTYSNGIYTAEDTVPINPTASKYGGTNVIYDAKYAESNIYGQEVSEYQSSNEIARTGDSVELSGDYGTEYGGKSPEIDGSTLTFYIGETYSHRLSALSKHHDSMELDLGLRLVSKDTDLVFTTVHNTYIEGTPDEKGQFTLTLENNTYIIVVKDAPVTYTVGLTFDANGGSGTAPSDLTNSEDFDSSPSGSYPFTLPGAGSLSKDGYSFIGWSTNKSATSTSYTEGKSYSVSYSSTKNPNIATLYAVWKKLNLPTSINVSNMTMGTSSGTQSAYVSFSPYNTTNKDVSATTNDSGIAEVTGGTGYVHVTPKGVGTATITVTCDAAPTVKTTFTVTVRQTETGTLSYMVNGQSWLTDSCSSYTGSFNYTITPSKPTSSGMVFTGWASSNGTIYQSGDSFTTTSKSSTLTARFQYQYTLSFADTGSSSISSIVRNSDSPSYEFTIPTTKPTKSGYEFDGWSRTQNGAINFAPGGTVSIRAGEYSNNTITLYGVWAVVYTYTLHFDTDGGSSVADLTKTSRERSVTFTSSDLASISTSKQGYLFNGWFKDGQLKVPPTGGTYTTASTSDTLKAGWLKIYVNGIHFDGRTSEITNWPEDMSSGDTNTSRSTTFVLPEDPRKEDYTFMGWSSDAYSGLKLHGESASVSDGDTITLTANWQLIHKTGIRYVLDNGEADWYNPHKGNDGSILCTVTSDTPQKQYMEFKGWKGQDDVKYSAGQTMLLQEDQTFVLTAQWEPIHITVTFVITQEPYKTQKVQTDMGHIINLPDQPERNWYMFTGWFIDKDCTERYDLSDYVLEPMTLYAGWVLTGKEYSDVPYAKMTILTKEPFQYCFDASMFSKDYYSVEWEFSDGSREADLTVTKTFEAGMYSVKLILTNNKGTVYEERFFGIDEAGSPTPYREPGDDNMLLYAAIGIVGAALAGFLIWRRGI